MLVNQIRPATLSAGIVFRVYLFWSKSTGSFRFWPLPLKVRLASRVEIRTGQISIGMYQIKSLSSIGMYQSKSLNSIGMYQSKSFFSLSIYLSKRCDDTPISSQRITQHTTQYTQRRMRPFGCRPSGARTKNRTLGARSGPPVGHRQPRPPDLGAPQNLKFNGHVCNVPTDNPPKSSIFMKQFTKDAPPASRSEPSVGHPHVT